MDWKKAPDDLVAAGHAEYVRRRTRTIVDEMLDKYNRQCMECDEGTSVLQVWLYGNYPRTRGHAAKARMLKRMEWPTQGVKLLCESCSMERLRSDRVQEA